MRSCIRALYRHYYYRNINFIYKYHKNSMHNLTNSEYEKLIEINFSNNIIQYDDKRLSTLFKNKIENTEKFYGLEISANSKVNLNYNNFKIQPLFTSIVWIGQLFSQHSNISDIAAIKCAELLKYNTIVLLHLTCYEMNKDKLNKYLNLKDYSNVLALRGDSVAENQEFKYASEMVKEIRNNRSDTISIGVGGYPDIHPEAKSREEDMKNLKLKVDAGADFIITQICFSADKIKEFILDCRKLNITVPVIPGIYIPNSYSSLKRVCDITKVEVPNNLMKKYEIYRDNDIEFRNFSIQTTIEMIKDLFDSNLGVYGVQFFTFNNFENVQKVVDKVF